MDRPINRRETLAAFTAAALALPELAKAAAWTPKALSAPQADTLTAASGLIMPATDTPGAIEVGAPQVIDRWLAEWASPDDAARLKAFLDRLDADAHAAGSASFAALSAERQTALLSRYDAEGRAQRAHPFAQLTDYVTIAYFTSRPGATRALRYDPVPGAYRGCVPLSEIGRGWATS
jgi:hypothetical protein